MNERLTPVNQALIIANLVVFGVQYFFPGLLERQFALHPLLSDGFGYGTFKPWQLVTYAFLHGGFMHLFFNMFALYMFGSEIERLFGPRRYLIYYLSCVVGAALLHLLVVQIADLPPAPVVGASGGVFGVLLAFGMAYPRQKLMLLFPPIPMPAWLFVTLYGLLELYLGITQSAQGIAHFAHLGGMLTGFILIRYWRQQARRVR